MFRLLPCLLLGLMAFGMLEPARRQSAAIDEVPHIGAGLSYLQRFDMRLNGEHPPMCKILAALPLVATGTHADYSAISWTFSDKFFPAYVAQWVFGEWVLHHWNDSRGVLFLARLPLLALTLVLGWVIYRCAVGLGGRAGGLLSLTVYVSAPVFLTFGPMVLTDVGVALFCLLTLWSFARLRADPGAGNLVLFSLALAGALLTKFSAGLVLIAIAIFIRYDGERSGPKPWRLFRSGIAGAALIVYVVYFVLSWNQPMDIQNRIGEGPVAIAIGRVVMPGWLYLRGMTMVLFTSSRPAFLLGESHSTGLPLYFPLLLLWKSQLGFLGLLAAGAALAFTRHRWNSVGIVPSERSGLWRLLWVSAIVFSSACILSRLNISFRHFTVPLALLILLLAPLPRALARIRQQHRVPGNVLTFLTLSLAVSCLVTTARAYPHFLPYTNALSFGRPAWQLFGDSNLDWNQALPDVEAFASSHGLDRLLVDPYGLSDPASVIPGARLWDCQIPAAADAGQWAAISANNILESHNCAWLIPHIRETLAGGSMYMVRLPSPIPAEGSPGGPPAPEARRKIFAMPIDLRALFVGISAHPENLPAAWAELERTFAPGSITDDLYPPKDKVHWPWDRH